MPLTINGLNVVSLSIYHPWRGTWIADVDFDPAGGVAPSSGPAVLTIGDSTTMRGTFDPTASGPFGEKARARVIGGGGGWHKALPARQFHNDAGVLDTYVITTTATEALETVAFVAAPRALGVDFDRAAGPASRVLDGIDWYVTPAGVTTIGLRIPTPANPLSIDILSWDPEQRVAELASDDLILPGTILTDTRFGSMTVRDVEQTFSSGGGARAKAWCSDNAAKGSSRLAEALRNVAREAAITAPYLKPYHYRVVTIGPDGRLNLQAVNKSAGVPDSLAIDIWYGVPGVAATIPLASEVAVSFLDGNPAKPVVTGFKRATIPNPSPVARATAVTALVSALETFSAALALAATGPLAPLAGPAGDLTNALTALAPDVAALTLQVD